MKVKIPKQIKIGAHPFSVYMQPHMKIDDGYTACVHFRTQKIHVDPTLPPSKRDIDFLHEVVHIIDDTFGSNLADADIDRVAQGWGEFLFNNLGMEFDWSDIETDG